MWVLYAFLGAVGAAFVAVFAKLGLKGVDPTLASAVRGVLMAGILVVIAAARGKFELLATRPFTGREWLFVALAGLAGALSWLFSFMALEAGPAGPASVIDRLSIVLVIILAALFLGEPLTAKSVAGASFIVLGALLVAKPELFDRLFAYLTVR